MSDAVPAVLVTAGGGPQGLAVVRLAAQARCRIVVADTAPHGMTAPLVDVYERVPPVAAGEACVEALLRLCRREEVRLVLPATDHELELLAETRERFEQGGVRVAVSEAGLLRQLRDKAALYPLLAAAGLPVLETLTPDPGAPVLPLIGKPRRGWGSRGLIVARAPADLAGLTTAERDGCVWQPFLDDAVELSADFAVGFDGSLSPIGLRRRLRVCGGFAVASETLHDPEAEGLIERLARLVAGRGGRGCFNVQLLGSGARLFVSDVNPRLGTSAVHWRDSAFNPVLWLCAEAGVAAEASAHRARLGGGVPPLRRSQRALEEEFGLPGEAAPVEGIVLDLDDTLIPTKRFIAARLAAALAVVAPPAELPRARREGLRIVEEGPRDRLIDAVAAALGWGEPQRRALLEAYGTSWPEACAVHEDVVPALAALRRAGYRLAVLTDNPPQTQRRKLEAAGLRAQLDAIVFAREHGAEKPDPRGFEAAAESLRLPAGRLAMAGDNPHRDLAGAAAAGYARLFWVRRPGASCGFDPALSAALPGFDRFEVVRDLRGMLYRLRR